MWFRSSREVASAVRGQYRLRFAAKESLDRPCPTATSSVSEAPAFDSFLPKSIFGYIDRYMKEALLLYGATEIGSPLFSSDMLWRTKFKAPDPFFLVDTGNKTYLFASPLERGRAQKEAKVDAVMPFDSGISDVISFLKKNKVGRVLIPFSFPHGLAQVFSKKFKVKISESLLYPERFRKTQAEIREIEKAQRAAEASLTRVRDILKKSKILGKKIYFHGKLLTSEILREAVDGELFKRGFLGIDTIVSSGVDAADPHSIGRGPIIPYSAIVFDIFPVSLSSHYFADMSRTLFKGKPNEGLIQMYEAVRITQEKCISMVKNGTDGKKIYEWSKANLEASGFPTDFKKEKPEGLFHGLGHGVGIDIHEPPSLGGTPTILEKGNVVTVEPGLYYPKPKGHIPAGGVRIEDMVLVGKKGCRNLTKMPKSLDWAIIP